MFHLRLKGQCRHRAWNRSDSVTENNTPHDKVMLPLLLSLGDIDFFHPR